MGGEGGEPPSCSGGSGSEGVRRAGAWHVWRAVNHPRRLRRRGEVRPMTAEEAGKMVGIWIMTGGIILRGLSKESTTN